MNENLNDNVSCIVRTVGERTTANCIRLLQEFLGTDAKIHTVSLSPFVSALEESLAIGNRLGKPWTLIIDADVLCSGHLMTKLLQTARDLPKETFMIEASVTDKFFGRYRRAGNHLYRTKWLSDALNILPRLQNSLRPETNLRNAMLASGFRSFQSYQIIGLHDYEQSFRDILRKISLFALKHTFWHEYLITLWESKPQDQDYQAALDGLRSASKDNENVLVDLEMLNRIPQSIIAKWLAQEKPQLDPTAISENEVRELVISELAERGITPTTQTDPVEDVLCVA